MLLSKAAPVAPKPARLMNSLLFNFLRVEFVQFGIKENTVTQCVVRDVVKLQKKLNCVRQAGESKVTNFHVGYQISVNANLFAQRF